ncbi:hypothetical protein NOS3756_08320 [Nostoc sp. NIES-3756]|uniref:caspase, EACC1-associated type n=1 Tax=Nostoc sp. NIES-3756 TaxID=1751286 RepID=UPI000722807B|nr:SUMF1/EgtB/PvdO family nonheme iron enzyme [Nostoc sp. NIES-3756]BAT51901.1 hypothetical protein NOS3756_08320 [Nostoc sp. NIES-3756]
MAKVALLIGISEYQEELTPLPNAVNDVEAMRRVLVNPEMGDFAEADVTVLKNPQRQQMEDAIYKLYANCQKDDVVLFYFSGHGVTVENGDFYFSTSLTQKDKNKLILPTAVAAKNVHDWMNQSKSKRQVIILDCCFSGAFAKGLTAKDDGTIDLQQYLGGEGRAILTASTSTQYAFESDSFDLSIYTHYLVEGIEKGAADQDGDGLIAVDELHSYAKSKVQEASPAMTPEFYPVKEGFRIFLAKSPKNDPKLKYRKEVERLCYAGKFTIPARRLLNSLRIQFQLDSDIADAIEAEVQQPYREYERKLKEYEATLIETIEVEPILSKITLRDLKDYQQHLGLRDEDVALIKAGIITSQQKSSISAEQSSEPIKPSSANQFEFDIVIVDAKGNVTNCSRGQAEYFTEDLGNGVFLDMVAIPGGQFLMGSPKNELERFDTESPQHEVNVQPFCMGKFSVTQAQWRAVSALNKVNMDLKPDPSHFKGANRPVEKVSWYDAVEFCLRLTAYTKREYRLSSEAEWEYACRAGTTTPFHFGETITSDLANYGANYTYGAGVEGVDRKETTEVGSFRVANAFGLYDMHGNVWEWCLDDWHENYQGAPTDGSPWFDDMVTERSQSNDNLYQKQGKAVLRGGSWLHYPKDCRSASRVNYGRAERSNRINTVGFRVVCAAGRILR